jgi:hypothetical protein
MTRIACLLTIAAAICLAGCEGTRVALEACDRALDAEPYQGPCWAKETFKGPKDAGSE